MVRRGIDISDHQGDIDLSALEPQIDFVIIRVGYGTKGSIDKKFKRNADLCERLSIPYGFYWYSYALTSDDAKKEATHFLNAIAPYKPTMGCWFDMEDADSYKKRNGMPSDSVLQDICYEFCNMVQEAGYYTGVYASQSWFDNQLAGERLSEFDKWIAQWPTHRGKQKGLDVDPDTRSDCSLWQFTSMGHYFGYDFDYVLDTNYAYKSFPNPKDLDIPPMETQEPILELVKKVMLGEYGNGDDRKENLGSRYNEVQDFINHIYSAPIDTLRQEIKDGKYGDEETVKIVLAPRYEELYTTPSITKGQKIRFTGTKSYSGIRLASWTHNDVFNVIEVSGDRIVIGKGSAVTAAVNIRDCELI